MNESRPSAIDYDVPEIKTLLDFDNALEHDWALHSYFPDIAILSKKQMGDFFRNPSGKYFIYDTEWGTVNVMTQDTYESLYSHGGKDSAVGPSTSILERYLKYGKQAL